MIKLKVSKVDAARRQIDTAIELLFGGGDPVSVHTLAAAGARVVRDLSEQKGGQPWDDIILPGRHKEFLAALNRRGNFLKHADRDTDEILELEEEANDAVLLMAVMSYRYLGHEATTEMGVFLSWWIIMHPSVWNPEQEEVARLYGNNYLDSTRQDRLDMGKALLDQRRRSQWLATARGNYRNSLDPSMG
jgi:hypothetical protein